MGKWRQKSRRADSVLVVDVGGSSLKLLATGEKKRIKIPSGKEMGPRDMIKQVQEATKHWDYEAISLGCPCAINDGMVVAEPVNLGKGWKGFEFEKAFGMPTQVINDATMQAIGAYAGGSMLFLGFGTGLGTTLIKDGTPIPMEGGHLPYKKGKSFEEYVGKAGLKEMGEEKWLEHVHEVIKILRAAFVVNEVVIGGGNAKLIKKMPPMSRRVNNDAAFEGGFRMWKGEMD